MLPDVAQACRICGLVQHLHRTFLNPLVRLLRAAGARQHDDGARGGCRAQEVTRGGNVIIFVVVVSRVCGGIVVFSRGGCWCTRMIRLKKVVVCVCSLVPFILVVVVANRRWLFFVFF